MTTSLAQQLKKLAVPETSIYKQEKKKASLLFDPKEAASIDRETFYEIGLSGLSELKTLNKDFIEYENTLFNLSSKNFERSVQSTDINERIDKIIKSFLIKLSPYFLLQSSHKTLEWLVNRYHIHKYNKDDLLALILPYHETRIFVRCLQIVDISHETDRWNWLEPLQKPGLPLAKTVLLNHCASNPSLLKFITRMVKQGVTEFQDRADLLSTLFTFYCSSVVGALEYATSITEAHINNIIPGLLKSLKSPLSDLKAAGFMITAQLVSKIQLKSKIIKHLVDTIIIHSSNIDYETILLLHILFHTQESLTSISETFLSNLSLSNMKNICLNLNVLIVENNDVMRFLKAFVKGSLSLIQLNVENLKRFGKILEMLVTEVKFNSSTAETLLTCVINNYSIEPQQQNSKETEDSDMDVIDEDTTDLIKLKTWYSNFLKTLESKYPTEFDKVLKNELKQNSQSKRNSSLNEILGFAPKLVKKMGDTLLFEKLYHQNADIRVEATKYLVLNFDNLKKNNETFLRESLCDRLKDDCPEVVSTILTVTIQDLCSLIGNEIMIVILKNILHNGRKDLSWRKTLVVALKYICTLDKSRNDLSVYMSILPYLFPVCKKSCSLAFIIIQSELGKQILSNGNISDLMENMDKPSLISKTIFEILKNGSWFPNASELLEIINSQEASNDYNAKMFALVLLSFSLKNKNSSELSLKMLQSVTNIVDYANCTFVKKLPCFTPTDFTYFIEMSNEEKFPLQVYSFFLENLIKKTDTSNIKKPWIANTVMKLDVHFISQLYKILINGCRKKYEVLYSPLLSLLINSHCSTFVEKIEFIGNFVIGDLSERTEKQQDEIDNVITFRSLKILFAQFKTSTDGLSWVYESDVILMMIILCLYSPITYIREITLDIINIIQIKANRKHHFSVLFSELLSRREEIHIDNEQVPLILHTLLSPDPSVHKSLSKVLQAPMKKALNAFIKIVSNESTPFNIKAKICNIFTHINSGEILTVLSEITLKLLEIDHENDCISNPFESELFNNIVLRINSITLKASLEKDIVWKFICTSMKKIKKKVMFNQDNYSFVCVLMMKQIDQDLFSVLSSQKAETLISFIIQTGTFGTDPSIVTAASKLIKRLELKATHILPTLLLMQQVSDQSGQQNSKKRNKTFTPSLAILDTREWKNGNTLLEYIQDKKKLSGIEEILPILFNILKKCLDFEEQSAVEYTKQLLLTSILHCSQKLYPMDSIESKKLPRGIMDIELIVMCIRGTQNPQTHHHALMLLSQAAFMLPDQVLHHMMAIFTFIGSSVLRHDDEYSFQIITKIIETVIPILVKSDQSHGKQNLHQLEKRVIPVLRIFVDVVLDVPEHRRLPLFMKLLLTLNPEHFMWTFLSLLFESHVVHGNEEKMVNSGKKIPNKEVPVRRIDFAMSLVSEFSPDIIMHSCIKLIEYLKTLPSDKSDDEIVKSVEIDPTIVFSIPTHTSKQLRHFKYSILSFINNILSSQIFKQKINSGHQKGEMENLYKTFIVNILTYIQNVSKAADQNMGKPQAKYWKVMLHHSYEILDNVNILLSVDMFIMVVRGLMSHNLTTVRRKSMEILNTKLQHQPSFFTDCDKEQVYTVLEPLIDIISEIGQNEADGFIKQEIEVNQQTALLSLKLFVRLLARDDPIKFKPILDLITNLTKSSVSGNLMASIVLCLAELCSNLKAHAIAFLPKFMPSLIKILKAQSSTDTTELVLLSVITAVYKIVETIPLFLSPYLEKLIYEFSVLSAKWDSSEGHNKNSPVLTKLNLIKNKISHAIAPRVLIPVVSQCYSQLIKKNKFNSIAPAMNILAESFSDISGSEFTSLQQELTGFFLLALQFRNDYADDISLEEIDVVEGHVIKALVALVLKLSESSFRPLYFKIFDWAVRTPNDENKEKAITFYRLSNSIAENLKGLFILFAGHFIKNSADLLDACNKNKTSDIFFESEDKCCILIENIIKTLYAVFLYDSQNFVNKDRFETIMQSLVDQLDNDVGGMESLKNRASTVIIPCIAQFAVATADDSLWKPLNYQILLKTRHNDAEIRLLGLECMSEMATKLGDSWLPLLPESVPFLAELLEDEVQTVETATQKAVQSLEAILGEPLQKYF